MFIPEKYKACVEAVLNRIIPGKGVVRSLAKTLTWRIIATTDTFFLGWLITGNIAYAGAIASLEVLTKMVLYFLHERAWARVGGHRYPPRRVRIKCRECGTPNSKMVHDRPLENSPGH